MLVRMLRITSLVEQIRRPLKLEADGIWCMLRAPGGEKSALCGDNEDDVHTEPLLNSDAVFELLGLA